MDDIRERIENARSNPTDFVEYLFDRKLTPCQKMLINMLNKKNKIEDKMRQVSRWHLSEKEQRHIDFLMKRMFMKDDE